MEYHLTREKTSTRHVASLLNRPRAKPVSQVQPVRPGEFMFLLLLDISKLFVWTDLEDCQIRKKEEKNLDWCLFSPPASLHNPPKKQKREGKDEKIAREKGR